MEFQKAEIPESTRRLNQNAKFAGDAKIVGGTTPVSSKSPGDTVPVPDTVATGVKDIDGDGDDDKLNGIEMDDKYGTTVVTQGLTINIRKNQYTVK